MCSQVRYIWTIWEFYFRFLGNLHANVHSAWSSLHSYQLSIRIPIFPHPHQCLLSLAFFMTDILVGAKGNVVFIHIYLMVKIGGLCISSVENYLLSWFTRLFLEASRVFRYLVAVLSHPAAIASLCSLLCHEAFSLPANTFAVLEALFWASGVLLRKFHVFKSFSCVCL